MAEQYEDVYARLCGRTGAIKEPVAGVVRERG
jgi:hypothetical protein